MALRSTVYKVDLQVSNLDRQVFDSRSLALARHPAETEERLMVRLLAYALPLAEGLAFGRGLWGLGIDVGLPDERVLRRASGRADAVVLYTYGGRPAVQWWEQNEPAL